MSILPKVNLRRTFLIARRDYVGYVKTWGFWISFLLPFIFGGFGFFMATADIELSPTQQVTILDETGLHKDGLLEIYDEMIEEKAKAVVSAKAFFIQDKKQRNEFQRILKVDGTEAAQAYITDNVPGLSATYEPPSADFVFVDPPANTLEGLMPYLKGESLLEIEGEQLPLGGAIVFRAGSDPARPETQYWTSNVNKEDASNLADWYLRRLSRMSYLEPKGLDVLELDRRVAEAPETKLFDPTKTIEDSQDVNQSDTVPFLVAAVLAAMLWLTVFSGAYMLLTSMLEEKLNKLLEMMLATTRFSEIILGKLLGVAALTLSMMAPYILVGIAGVISYVFFGSDQDVVKGLVSAFNAKMIIFLIIYLILGYILYGAFFIALGSLSSSMQDAQTLTTPILFILMACVVVIPLGMSDPDSPLLRIATFIPFSAPFANIVRLPSDPPLWELLLSTAFLTLLCIGTIAMAGRIFRFGVLSGAGAEVVIGWFKRVVLRRKA
ncbi:MAG: ABC transporter permease [Litorimonas sp.]